MADDAAFEVADEYLFVGRTFGEYCDMFGLAPTGLEGRTILDCPGGPGSFTAVASRLGADVTAVDPMYGLHVEGLEAACLDAVERNVAQLREKRDLFVWSYHGDPETRGRFQRAAAERFLADYATNPGRYLRGALPDLPLATDAVDLALAGNFPFLYDDRLDEPFHVAALRELARVASEAVRVYPLHSLDRQRSELVGRVVDELRAEGLACRLESVPYEFQPGATEALVVAADPGERSRHTPPTPTAPHGTDSD